MLKKKWKSTNSIVCRAHRYDIYEEQHANNYIPLRRYILNNVDYVFPCSESGVRYIGKYGDVKATVECRYLGTVDYGERQIESGMSPLKVVSCSTAVKVKRLEKIVNALSLLRDMEIEWTHYGDGPLLGDIKKKASVKLGKNVRVVFAGNILNSELLRTYAENDYHLFLNVSSSEGLPVSIMEAMSFGIPCIATDVGGTKELVNNENGFLVEADVDDGKIADLIRIISQMGFDEYRMLRKKARNSWEDKFNSKENYSQFIGSLERL